MFPVLKSSSLGSSRFLKTVKCGHRNGPLVVKVFIKPDPGLSLRTYARRLKCKNYIPPPFVGAFHRACIAEREALLDISNVYNYQIFVENDRGGYLVRQWLEGNLYDRIRCVSTAQYGGYVMIAVVINSTRPFLSSIEKKWIAFQLLNGMRDARKRNVCFLISFGKCSVTIFIRYLTEISSLRTCL